MAKTKSKKESAGRNTVAEFFRAIQVCEAISDLEEALKKIDAQIKLSKIKHQQLINFRGEAQKRLSVLRKEPGQ